LLLQASSGFVGAAVIAANINPIKAGKTMAKATKAAGLSMYKGSKLNTFLDETGLGVQLRNIVHETYLTPSDYRTSLGPKRARKFATNATQFALQSSDNFPYAYLSSFGSLPPLLAFLHLLLMADTQHYPLITRQYYTQNLL